MKNTNQNSVVSSINDNLISVMSNEGLETLIKKTEVSVIALKENYKSIDDEFVVIFHFNTDSQDHIEYFKSLEDAENYFDASITELGEELFYDFESSDSEYKAFRKSLYNSSKVAENKRGSGYIVLINLSKRSRPQVETFDKVEDANNFNRQMVIELMS